MPPSRRWPVLALVPTLALFSCGGGAVDPDLGVFTDAGLGGSGGVDGGSRPGDGAPPSTGEPFYVLDLRSTYLNCFAGCQTGKGSATGAQLIDRLDALMFATSVQGIVNRTGPRLYVLATAADDFWLAQALDGTKPWGWAAGHQRRDVASVLDLLSTFAADLKGSVRWTAALPATLNVAATAAGVDSLAVVREGSTLEAAVTATWPIATDRDLVGKFANKRAAMSWARSALQSKCRPDLLGYQQDGWPWTRLGAGSNGSDFGGPSILARDYLIAEKAYQFDLSPWGDQAPLDDPTQPVGADRAELSATLSAARAATAGKAPLSIWGFYTIEKYATGLHAEPVSGEWETARLTSFLGARITGGGGQAYGLELANASFHRWGSFPRHAPRRRTPSPMELADLGYLNQHLLNPGFDWNSPGGWTLSAANRAIYTQNGAPGGHERWLQMNGAVDSGLYQDVAIAPQPGHSWRLRVQYRIPAGGSPGRLVLWALGGTVESVPTTLALADGKWHQAEVTLSAQQAGHTALRAQVYLDQAGKSLDLDEFRLARVTPWSNDVAPLTFLSFFQGDYDGGTGIYAVPVAVSPKGWLAQGRGKLPLAWDFAPDTIEYLPGVMHYYWSTATDNDLFTVPNTGAGYLNPDHLSAADQDLFIRFSRRWMGRLGESAMSLFLNGFAHSPSAAVIDKWRALGPDGVLANELAAPSQRLVGNVPWLAIDGNAWSYGGISEAAATQSLRDAYTARFGSSTAGARFLAGRNIFSGPDLNVQMLANVRSSHPERDYTAVDPYTFGFLFRQARGGTNTQRVSFIDDSIPRSAKVGSTVTATVRVRNDGWDTWSASSCVLGVVGGANVEATPLSTPGAARVEHPLPKAVGPGETVDVAISAKLPSTGTTAALSYDVACGGNYFEQALNLPYRDTIDLVP